MALHGEQKNYRIEQECLIETYTLEDGTQFEMTIPAAKEESVSERFCRVCEGWVETRGVLGALWCPECITGWGQ